MRNQPEQGLPSNKPSAAALDDRASTLVPCCLQICQKWNLQKRRRSSSDSSTDRPVPDSTVAEMQAIEWDSAPATAYLSFYQSCQTTTTMLLPMMTSQSCSRNSLQTLLYLLQKGRSFVSSSCRHCRLLLLLLTQCRRSHRSACWSGTGPVYVGSDRRDSI